MTSDRDRIVFHGTRNPPGTPSTVLTPPSFDHPFFVADNPKIAISYINPSAGSIFVLRMKNPPKKIAFDFRNKAHMSQLARKIPRTANFINNYMDYGLGNNFYGASKMLDLAASVVDKNDDAYDPDIMEARRADYEYNWNALEELGLLIYNGEDEYDYELSDEMRKFNSYGTARRRFIKSKIYEEIYNMGYMVVMDGDTTGKRFMGHEFAIFDLNVFEEGFTESLPLKDIRAAIEYAYPRSGLK